MRRCKEWRWTKWWKVVFIVGVEKHKMQQVNVSEGKRARTGFGS